MVRPREFDRDVALEKATQLFWDQGYAATSTDDLRNAMGIGRQSMYNAFGDKRQLYLEVLGAYQARNLEAHLRRLNEPASALEGLREVLKGLAAADDRVRAMGCFGVGATGEFGAHDPELSGMSAKTSALLGARLVDKVREGQHKGEIASHLDPEHTAAFVMLSMTGLQVAARAGASVESMHGMADFAIDLIKAS